MSRNQSHGSIWTTKYRRKNRNPTRCHSGQAALATGGVVE
jgi:hypothetical protein